MFLILILGLNYLNAADLIIKNESGSYIKIERLNNKCSGDVVSPTNPKLLLNKKEFIFKNLNNIVHTYRICGSGVCSISAFGMKKGHRLYKAKITNKWMDLVITPDHWIGNLKCN